ncbi:MAG: acyltransferase [Dysgonamonadaceae bacterium]|jgi:surface polysaccharide O-acyltransferase-like enzyme|nr:acyltransferase [Dysgonamonadaceae bacterium]
MNLQSKTIDFLRFPLMLMVIFIHNPHLGIDMQNIDYTNLTGEGIYSIVVTLGHYTLTHIAVPGFFMFSGFLFFYKTSEFTHVQYFNKLKKRIKTLFIPYLLWNTLFISISWIIAMKNGELVAFWTNLSDKGIFSIFWNHSTWGNPLENQIFYGPALVPLWFLRDLILSIILSPIIYYLVKYTKIFGIIGLGFLYYFNIGFVVEGYNLNQLICAVFFFAFGGYFSINAKNLVLSFRKVQIFSSLLAVTSLVFSVYFYPTKIFNYIYPIYVISGVITMVNMASFLLERNKVKEIELLSKASFFVYLSHTVLILGFSRRCLNIIIPFDNYIVLTIKYLITPFLCAFICIVLYSLLRKFMPKFLAIIVGGRS